MKIKKEYVIAAVIIIILLFVIYTSYEPNRSIGAEGTYNINVDYQTESGSYTADPEGPYVLEEGLFGLTNATEINSWTGIEDTIAGTKFTCNDFGIAKTINVGIKDVNVESKARCAIYDSSLNLLELTEEKTLPIGIENEIWSFNLLNDVNLVPDDYILVIMSDGDMYINMQGNVYDYTNWYIETETYESGFPESIEQGTSIYEKLLWCEYEIPTEVTLTAYPNDGYSFVKWVDESTEYTDNPITVTVDGEKNLDLIFQNNNPTEDTPEPKDTPGFEILTLIASLGIVFIIIRRKRK